MSGIFGVNNLIGNEKPSNKVQRTQVFQATHSREGAEKRLPFMYRSFISFTYGGKYIEDFGLIAITENDSIDRQLYSSFTDQVTDLEVLNGQLYWGTYYNANRLELTLCTDEITEKQLTTFAQWFKPGYARELVLAEHPNRAIMARLESPPEYHMLPFGKKITSNIFGTQTSTTVYRGKIKITFVMDDPFWYSKINAISYDEGDEEWINYITGEIINLPVEDVAKFVEEDDLPIIQAITNKVLIGEPLNFSSNDIVAPARVAEDDEVNLNGSEVIIEEITVDWAIIGGSITINPINNPDEAVDIENFNANTPHYFFYGGTAPGEPYLEFTIPNPINDIANSYNKINNKTYNTIAIESINKQELRFTSPSVLTAYYQAQAIGPDDTEALRDGVNHPLVRNYVIQHNGQLPTITNMTFKINCKTGETTIKYEFNGEEQSEEDAGDAIKSKYLKIEDRNYPTKEGYVMPWESQNKEYSHKIWHDVRNGLRNFKFRYKYMYL